MGRRGKGSPLLTPLASAKEDAYRLLARRPRTRREMERYLKSRAYQEGTIQEILDLLSSLNYLDDEAFAREWGRYRLETRPMGEQGLRRELRGKGVALNVIDAALRELFSEVDEGDLALRLAEQKARKGQEDSPVVARRRVRDFLLRRGFSFEATDDALRHVFGSDREPEI